MACAETIAGKYSTGYFSPGSGRKYGTNKISDPYGTDQDKSFYGREPGQIAFQGGFCLLKAGKPENIGQGENTCKKYQILKGIGYLKTVFCEFQRVEVPRIIRHLLHREFIAGLVQPVGSFRNILRNMPGIIVF